MSVGWRYSIIGRVVVDCIRRMMEGRAMRQVGITDNRSGLVTWSVRNGQVRQYNVGGASAERLLSVVMRSPQFMFHRGGSGFSWYAQEVKTE